MNNKNTKIYKNVKIGINSEISDYVILGYPPKGKKNGELKLEIGKESIRPRKTRIHPAGGEGPYIFAGNHTGRVRFRVCVPLITRAVKMTKRAIEAQANQSPR